MTDKERAKRARAVVAKRLRRATDPVWRDHENAMHRARSHGQKYIPDGQQLKSVSLLTNEQTGELSASWTKTEHVAGPVVTPPPDFTIDRISTMTVAGEPRVQWTSHDKQKADAWAQFIKALELHTEQYKGIADPVSAPVSDENSLTLYPLGDPHIGMYSWGQETGENFDLKIANRDLIACVDMLVDRAPISAVGVLCNVGDFYHAETDAQVTPRGNNKLDVDGRSAKVMALGCNLMRHLIDRLLQKHGRVIAYNLRGNHDPSRATMLAMWLRAVYEREPRVEVAETLNPYTYLRHGKTLLGFHHGDGARIEQLPGIMAADRPEDWGRTDFRYWITGHIHKSTKNDFPGCSVESFRTLAPADYWAWHKGYRSMQSLSAITYDTAYGEITRSTVDLRLARAK